MTFLNDYTLSEHGSSIVPQRNERSTLGATARGLLYEGCICVKVKVPITIISLIFRKGKINQ